MKDIIVLYKDNTIKLKDLDNFLPRDMTKLEDIEMFLIPLLDNDYPIYIPINPNKLLYADKYIVDIVIGSMTIDMEEEELYPGDGCYSNKEFDNPIEFLNYIYTAFKISGFDFMSEEWTSLIGYDTVGYIILINYLNIKFFKNNDIIDHIKFKQTPMKYTDIIYHGPISFADKCIGAVKEFFIIEDHKEMLTPIAFNSDTWKYSKATKKIESFLLYPIEAYNAYYLIDEDDIEVLTTFKNITIVIKIIDTPKENLVDVNAVLSYAKRIKLIEEIEDESLEYLDEFYIRLYSINDFLRTIAFLYDSVKYIEFIMIYLLWGGYEEERDNICSVILIQDQDSTNYRSIYFSEELLTDDFHNEIKQLLQRKR